MIGAVSPNKLLSWMSPDTSRAQGTLSQYGQYLQPYYDAGTQALGTYGQLSSQMASDPTAYYNSIMSGYSASPYEQYQLNLLQEHTNQAAAAGGMLGTPNEQYTLAKDIEPLATASQQQYYQNVMAPQQMGMHGLGDLSHLGFGATEQYGDLFGNLAQMQAASAYAPYQLAGQLVGAGAPAMMSHFL